MLDLARPEDVEEFVGPFFVHKSGKSSLRFIIDARRANRRFRKAPRTSLPSGATIGDVWVDSPEPLHGTGADIKHFFYRIGMPLCLRRFFGLRPVDPRKLKSPLGR